MSDLLEHAPCAFVSFGDDSVVHAANAMLLSLLGREREQVVGASFQSFLAAGGRIFYQTHFFPLLRMRGVVEEIYLSLRGATGEELPVLVNARRNERDGRVFNDCIMMRIRERARFEEELLLARNAAQKASKAKDDFLAALSHELRNPLNPVLMLSTALEMDASLPLEAREQIGVIRRNAELEARLIDDLLDLTRIQHGKLKLMQAPVDLHLLLRHTEEIVRSDGQGKRVPVRFVKEASDHFIHADAARIQQVFWNIVKNAIKFTPAGGEVRVATSNPQPNRLAVQIVDTGIGIAPEILPRIFDAFEQGAISTHQFGGLGLGLAITRAIVQMHGGLIRADSAGPGLGSTFTVEFATCAAPESVSHPFPVAMPSSGCQLRLLVVEDHDSTREVLARILRRSGHEVHAVGTGGEALRVAEASDPFDILISDLGLPDQSGFELMQTIKAKYGWPGIALSGYGMDDDLRNARDAGFSGHLIKPVSIERLRLLIDEVMIGRPVTL